jgi:hypothetical protein
MIPLTARLKRVPVVAAANARLKAWMVEQDAARIRRRYSKLARKSGIGVPDGDVLRDALRSRIGVRGTRLGWPRPRGGLHVFLAYSLCNWEAVLPRALAEFGEVSEFEFRSAGFDEASPGWLRERQAMNAALLESFETANRRRPIDVVVGYFSGYTVDPTVLRRMAELGAVTTNFCFDDKVRWPGRVLGGRHTSTAALADTVDLNLSSDPAAAARYFAHGGLCMFHPEAADERWYRPLEVPFEHDVSFVGACFGWRPRLIDGLRDRGIQVACFGRGWPSGAVANEAMNGIYARSRVSLGCGGIGYSRDLLCLKGRDFEVPMAGALYLTQDNPELSAVFDVGREILTYRGIDDCASTIREVLADPPRAARIRAAARARCLLDHTYRARWSGVFQKLGALAPSAPARPWTDAADTAGARTWAGGAVAAAAAD